MGLVVANKFDVTFLEAKNVVIVVAVFGVVVVRVVHFIHFWPINLHLRLMKFTIEFVWGGE